MSSFIKAIKPLLSGLNRGSFRMSGISWNDMLHYPPTWHIILFVRRRQFYFLLSPLIAFIGMMDGFPPFASILIRSYDSTTTKYYYNHTRTITLWNEEKPKLALLSMCQTKFDDTQIEILTLNYLFHNRMKTVNLF